MLMYDVDNVNMNIFNFLILHISLRNNIFNSIGSSYNCHFFKLFNTELGNKHICQMNNSLHKHEDKINNELD